jgi:hypothetical protein
VVIEEAGRTERERGVPRRSLPNVEPSPPWTVPITEVENSRNIYVTPSLGSLLHRTSYRQFVDT